MFIVVICVTFQVKNTSILFIFLEFEVGTAITFFSHSSPDVIKNRYYNIYAMNIKQMLSHISHV